MGNGYNPIVVDSNNNPHIAYTDYVNGTYFVMYASWNGSDWSTQTVAEGFAFSLVLDANGNPQVLYNNPYVGSYPEGPSRPLMYASWTGTNWNIQTVDKHVGYGVVALDSSGNPNVAYTTGKTVKYASWIGSNWNIQTVDTDSVLGPSYLAVDSNGNSHISYRAVGPWPTMASIMYATATETTVAEPTQPSSPTQDPPTFSALPLLLVLTAVIIVAVVTVVVYVWKKKFHRQP